ncbi:MAG TPA: DUF229 domain-containing protein, partial [Bacteroidetes bacterium]|nr:DUF229 domain-containing protein [Bacteroidota bacterium]
MGIMKNRNLIFLYLYIGLAFLLWENLIGSILGTYNLELRRTLWGVIYYSLLFLVFGGVAEGINFLYNRLSPKYYWFGQKYVWLLVILIIFLWGNLPHQFLVKLFGYHSVLGSYYLNLFWLPLIFFAGWLVNVKLAKLWQADKLASPSRMTIYFSFVLFYLMVGTKLTYRFFHADVTSSYNILLQVALIVGAWLLALSMGKIFVSNSSYRKAVILVPIVATIAVLGISTGLKSNKQTSTDVTTPRADRPNIVVLLFDALRADHVGAICEDYNLTPTIDSLARSGKAYKSCYSTSSWTFPAIVSLLTSKLPNKLGLLEPRRLPKNMPTLTSILSGNGYYTAGLSANDMISSAYGFDSAFDEFRFVRPRGPNQLLLPLNSFFHAPLFMKEMAYQLGFISMNYVTADWREMNKKATKLYEKIGSQPFFLYMHYIEPHYPYWSVPFEECLIDLKNVRFAGSFLDLRRGDPEAMKFFSENKEHLLESQHQRYMNGARTADRAVADMLQILQQQGLKDNTVIIILSDHGEEFFEHEFIFHKSTLYDEQVLIPLIINIPPAFGIDLPDQLAGVSLLDVAPTVLELTGIGGGILESDGRSLLGYYPVHPRPRYMMLKTRKRDMSAVVQEPYKLILQNQNGVGYPDTLLFNLSVDKAEKINLYPQEKHIADSLAAYLQNQ